MKEGGEDEGKEGGKEEGKDREGKEVHLTTPKVTGSLGSGQT